ncbi:MAG: serine/threonine protein kinase [Myxococcota bacterium]
MEKIGKYQLKEYIASGGMAEIYKGSLEGPHGFIKDVVIKAIHPHLLKDERYINLFLREAKLWARLNHSSIVQVFEFFEERGRYYLVMEYIKGTDLMGVIKRAHSKGKSLGIPRTLKIFESVLSALEYAHNFRDEQEEIYGIIHRDISPQNILISVNGDVKITDFGIAKASISTGLTTQGAIIGKIDYMSPEQALGREIDHRTDIFSTGVVLWETLTENRLFDGKSDIELLENVRRCEIIRPSTINPEIDERLERIVLKSLQYDREFRYKSAAAFADDLKSYLREYPHEIAEENLSDFMRELFPEYVKDYTHRTELLEDSNGVQKKRVPIRSIVLISTILLLLIISSAIIFYPRSYRPSIQSTSTTNKDNIQTIKENPDKEPSPDIIINKGESVEITEKVEEKGDKGSEEVPDAPGKTPPHHLKSQERKKVTDAVRKGRLSVNAIPWADIYIGKKRLGTTPIFGYELRTGTVEVTFKNDELGISRKKRLIIEPDKETKYTEDLTR